MNRRRFLQQTTLLAAAGAVAPLWIPSSRTLADDAKSPNSRLRLGCIGTGDRWRDVGVNHAIKFADCVAVCDVDANHAEEGKKLATAANEKHGSSKPNIDASHERARFEEIERRKSGERAASQGLLIPAVAQLTPSLALLAEECAGELGELGFEVESFGSGSFLVRAIPHLLSGRDPVEAVTGVLHQLEDSANSHWAIEGRRHRLAASLACHSAVRAGQKISLATMNEIVAGLMATEFQDFCPHGRPTRHRIPKEDIARWFERTGWRRS